MAERMLEVEGEKVEAVINGCKAVFESHDLVVIYTALTVLMADVLLQVGNGNIEASLKQAAASPVNIIEYMYMIKKEKENESSKRLDS